MYEKMNQNSIILLQIAANKMNRSKKLIIVLFSNRQTFEKDDDEVNPIVKFTGNVHCVAMSIQFPV